MAPNTDRFKKYAHDNVLLWILREFERKKRKGIEPVGLKRPELAAAFTRRRTYPQTSLPKILKEVSIFEGGTYIMSEPAKVCHSLSSTALIFRYLMALKTPSEALVESLVSWKYQNRTF